LSALFKISSVSLLFLFFKFQFRIVRSKIFINKQFALLLLDIFHGWGSGANRSLCALSPNPIAENGSASRRGRKAGRQLRPC
jgi:hypothetical protein